MLRSISVHRLVAWGSIVILGAVLLTLKSASYVDRKEEQPPSPVADQVRVPSGADRQLSEDARAARVRQLKFDAGLGGLPLKEELALLREAWMLAPHDETIPAAISMRLTDLGDYVEALRINEIATKMYEQSNSRYMDGPLFQKVKILAHLGDYRGSRQVFELLIARKPTYADNYRWIADIFEELPQKGRVDDPDVRFWRDHWPTEDHQEFLRRLVGVKNRTPYATVATVLGFPHMCRAFSAEGMDFIVWEYSPKPIHRKDIGAFRVVWGEDDEKPIPNYLFYFLDGTLVGWLKRLPREPEPEWTYVLEAAQKLWEELNRAESEQSSAGTGTKNAGKPAPPK